ncbi:VOC family protein [Ktedonospora formicarum]|nr:VOC family protein [Ktedonospora formicarum]
MLIGLDHVIIGVNNLEAGTRIFQEDLGLIPSGGGQHPTGGTANRIIVIGDTYLELITIQKPEEAQQSIRERLAQGDGYLNCVFGSDAIAADSAAMSTRGISIIGPYAGALHSPGGQSRAWQRTDVERPDLAQHYPFLIQHDSSGQERRMRLAGWQEPPTHPLGVTGVLSTTLAVEDLEEATVRFQRVYGLEPSEPFSGEFEGWEAQIAAFSLGKAPHNGAQRFELASPLSKEHVSVETPNYLPAKGALAAHLQRYGESLCRMTLMVNDLAAARHYLNARHITYTHQEQGNPLLWIHPSQACGASIMLVEG